MLSNILSFGKCLLDFILLFWFSMQFFNQKQEQQQIFSYGILITFSFIIYGVNTLHMPLVNTCISVACTFALNLLLFRGHATALLLCSIAQVILIVICEFVPISVYSLMDKTSIAAITNETIRNAGFNLISTGISSVVILLIRHAVSLKRKKENINISISENLGIIIVPIVSIIIIYYILFTSPDVEMNHLLPLHSLSIFLGILLMNIVVIMSDSNLRKRYQLQRELDRLNRLEQLSRVVIEQQDQFIDEFKGFAHDYAKQVKEIKKLIRAENNAIPKEVERYADEMYNHIERTYSFAFIPSAALRSILTQTQLHCINSGIDFDTNIQYADFCFMEFPDLYSLFENPLENAIRACKEIKDTDSPRYIKLSILRKRNLVLIKIQNSKDNPIVIKNDTIQTTKAEALEHGMGIKNIKRVISHYEGYITVNYTEKEFFVTMTLPVPENKIVWSHPMYKKQEI